MTERTRTNLFHLFIVAMLLAMVFGVVYPIFTWKPKESKLIHTCPPPVEKTDKCPTCGKSINL